MGFGRKVRSFREMNEVRRQRSIQRRKQEELRRERQREQTEIAINRMQTSANIFAINVNASFNVVDNLIRAAQQIRIDTAIAKSERTQADAASLKGGSADIKV
ncbi:MAG: hypothetical protein HRU29_02750 [Rhizobiales bacterium]|nr:hypothetical protein [Hyphomicrobiales bacterium]NRB13298.1 hypothetical protein [Hyphomicrobiales bacterium]